MTGVQADGERAIQPFVIQHRPFANTYHALFRSAFRSWGSRLWTNQTIFVPRILSSERFNRTLKISSQSRRFERNLQKSSSGQWMIYKFCFLIIVRQEVGFADTTFSPSLKIRSVIISIKGFSCGGAGQERTTNPSSTLRVTFHP